VWPAAGYRSPTEDLPDHNRNSAQELGGQQRPTPGPLQFSQQQRAAAATDQDAALAGVDHVAGYAVSLNIRPRAPDPKRRAA
jgi:hypothetical protein